MMERRCRAALFNPPTVAEYPVPREVGEESRLARWQDHKQADSLYAPRRSERAYPSDLFGNGRGRVNEPTARMLA